MNLRTTIVLGVLVVLGIAGWVAYGLLQPKAPESATLTYLQSLEAKDITQVEIRRGEATLLSLSKVNDAWQLPGGWPLREKEVEELLATLTSLHSRYEAIPVVEKKEKGKPSLTDYGLTDSPLQVKIVARGEEHTLHLAEPEADEKNRFSRPTFLRLDKQTEVVRLGPGVVSRLDRPQEYYQKRQLFKSERVAEDTKSKKKVDEVIAKEIRVIGPGAAPVTLVKKGDDWQLSEPTDRADADRVKALLTKTPDIWAESFLKPSALKEKFESWPEPVTGLMPALPKRDFYTTQAVYVASQMIAMGADLVRPGSLSPVPAMQESVVLGHALPVYSVKVTRPDGGTLSLHVGSIARESRRRQMKTINIPGKGPMTIPEEVAEEFRYARIEDPGSGKGLDAMALFEVKGDVLKTMPTEIDELREARLVRFDTDEVRRLEILTPAEGKKADLQTALLLTKVKQAAPVEKKKERDPLEDLLKKDDDPFKKDDPDEKKEKETEVWRMQKPTEEAVEKEPLNELLRELSRLEARGQDVFYPAEADLGKFGLDQPSYVIKLTYEEEVKDKKPASRLRRDKEKEKKTKEVTFHIGSIAKSPVVDSKKGKEKEENKADRKVYVRVEGWPRVSLVDEKVLDLVKRPAYAYRTRKLLDLAAADVQKIEIQRGKDSLILAREKDDWKLQAPVSAPAEKSKVQPLLKELSQIEAVEFTADKPGKEDLDKLYGLAAPAVKVEITTDDAKKGKRVLHVGKQRPDRPDYYARLDDGPVFVLKKDVAEDLLRDPIAYRALPLWKLDAEDVAEISIQKKEGSYKLVRDGGKWKIAGAIDAPASKQAGFFAVQLADLRAVKYVDLLGKETAKYGLDAPELKVTIKSKEKDAKEKTLLIGNAVEKGDTDRYARIEGESGILVLGGKTVASLDRTAYDWLDRVLLTINPAEIQSLQVAGKSSYSLVKKSGEWLVTKSPAADYTAEEQTVMEMLGPWRSLQAEKIAATGSKIDWGKYGLEKPTLTITVSVALPEGKPVSHTLSLGGEAEKGQRYARMDKSDFVAVLGPDTVEALEKSHTDFLPLEVLRYTLTDLTGIGRTMPGGDVTISKRGEQWYLEKPYDRPADDLVVREITDRTFRLRAKRIVAYPAKDLGPYGLDKPAATVRFLLADPTGAPSEEKLLIGNVVDAKKDTGERYAMKEKGDKVFVLPADLSRAFTAQPLYFADRNFDPFRTADQAIQEREKRRAVFTRMGPLWKMTGPVESPAEDNELEVFVKDLSRLRVGELVASKPDEAQIKTFGLDKPEATWTFRQSDKQVFKLIVGGPEKGQGKDVRHYARMETDKKENGELVFLLTPKMTKQALAEYRERKPWTVDAARVEDVRYTSPAGAFRLSKREGKWSLFERPDDKVSTKSLNDALDALADLKVVRYLSDKEDQEQEVLTGLQKPEWTVQIGTGKESHKLLIGRKVGDSNQRYAKVEGEPGLFIVSAETVERLLRPQTAFVGDGKEEKKGAEKKIDDDDKD